MKSTVMISELNLCFVVVLYVLVESSFCLCMAFYFVSCLSTALSNLFAFFVADNDNLLFCVTLHCTIFSLSKSLYSGHLPVSFKLLCKHASS